MDETKIEKVKKHLIEHGTITQRDATRYYDSWRLSSIISDLRYKYGWEIETERVPNKDSGTHGVYHLISYPKEKPKKRGKNNGISD